MDNLNEAVATALEELAMQEKRREAAMACSRRVIRLSKSVIHGLHAETGCEEAMAEMDAELESMLAECGDGATLLCGPVQDAMSEYAEAVIFEAAFRDGRIPGFVELKVSAGAWIQGMADAEGELRRSVVTRLAEDDVDGARELFSRMEEIHEELMMADVPDAVAPVRRKQDIARGIMDKTRSDVATATVMRRFRDSQKKE